MQTMHVQPGRCLGCLVVAPTDASPDSSILSPRAAAVARASKPEGSCSRVFLSLSTALRFLKSSQKHRLKKNYHVIAVYFDKNSTNIDENHDYNRNYVIQWNATP